MSESTQGKASKSRQTFRRSVRVSIGIAASPERIWALLTDAADQPRWNSTVTAIEGRVALGEKLAIRVPITKRVFHVKVDRCEAAKLLVWSAGSPVFRGVRTYTLEASPRGTTTCTMEEVFTGFLLPMIAPSLPDFGPLFESFAADLKREAERPR